MGAIDNFMRKLGFVRLDRYGLVQTPDDRILSTRPTVLDDGVGGKIVGWLESDLAAMELERWAPLGTAQPEKKDKPKPIAFPMAAQTIAPAARPLPGVAAIATAPTVPLAAPKPVAAPAPAPVLAPVPVPAPAPVPAPVAVAAPAPAPDVAPEPPVEEDEWEWEIAVARARAEAKPVAAAPEPVPAPAPAPAPTRAPKVTAQPIAVAAKPAPAPAPAPAQRPSFVSTPGTVIPVPALPTVSDPRLVRPAVVASAPKRFPKATGRVEDTIRTHAAPAANDDRTQPSISLPPAATTIGLPSAKRVAAKQR